MILFCLETALLFTLLVQRVAVRVAARRACAAVFAGPGQRKPQAGHRRDLGRLSGVAARAARQP